jgi:leader peptidase (prepilin peptidase)/N-methyltransferase
LTGAVVAGGFFAAIILVYPGAMGWGDPKMAALIGLIAGLPGTVVALLGALLSGGILATALLIARRRGRKDSMPFGPFLAVGGTLALLWGDSLWTWYLGLVTAGSLG